MSKDTDYPNIYFNDNLIVSSREVREEIIRQRRKLGWVFRIIPKKMGEAVRKHIDEVIRDILLKGVDDGKSV